MNFLNNLKSLFIAAKDDNIPIAVRDAFSAARSRYEKCQEINQTNTTRSKHRLAIFRARHSFDQNKDADAYKKEIAAYTDMADFASYTEAELDTHTTDLENLTDAFDAFYTAFTALNTATKNGDNEFYVSAVACVNVYCETYKIAVDAYKTTALFAASAAAETKAKIVENSAKAWIKSLASNPDAEVTTTDDEIKAELFQKKARVAEAKAEAFLSKAKEVTGE